LLIIIGVEVEEGLAVVEEVVVAVAVVVGVLEP
jgi:hypothetical protein